MDKGNRTDNQVMLRELSILLGVPALLIAVVLLLWRPWAHYEVPAATDMYAVVAGTWDWADADSFCVRNPHTISFSSDRRVMLLTFKRPWTDSAGVRHQVAEYDIEEVTRRHVRGLIRGETRLTEAGKAVVWDLVLASPDEYRWHRTDWPPGGYTKPVRRCPSSASHPTGL